MINPFQDAPEELCRRVLKIWDDLYDEEIGQMAGGPLDPHVVTMLEMRVHMARIGKSMNVAGNISWTAPSGALYSNRGISAPASLSNFGPVTITYTAQGTGTPRSGKFWRRPRGSAR